MAGAPALGAVVGELVIVAIGTRVLGLALPLGLMLSLVRLRRNPHLVAITAATNLVLELRLARRVPTSRELCGAVLPFDTLALTVPLHATGGPANPFSVLYMVHINLAAVTLGSRWTWGLTALSAAATAACSFPNWPPRTGPTTPTAPSRATCERCDSPSPWPRP